MSFTITSKIERLPSYPTLRALAERNQVQVTGNERSGSFSSCDVGGKYEFDETGLRGSFAGRGVKGEFAFTTGTAVVTVSDKPFWFPEKLLKQKIAEGLEILRSQAV